MLPTRFSVTGMRAARASARSPSVNAREMPSSFS